MTDGESDCSNKTLEDNISLCSDFFRGPPERDKKVTDITTHYSDTENVVNRRFINAVEKMTEITRIPEQRTT